MLAGVALAIPIVAGSLSVPASAADVPRLGYVGRVAGTKAFVGVVVRGSRVTAYVCDGRKLARWFEGTLRGERARLRGRSGGRLTLKVAVSAPGTRCAAPARAQAASVRGIGGAGPRRAVPRRAGRDPVGPASASADGLGAPQQRPGARRHRHQPLPDRASVAWHHRRTGRGHGRHDQLALECAGARSARHRHGLADLQVAHRRDHEHPPAADDAGLRDPARRDRAEPPGRTERALAAARLPALAGGARLLRRQDRRSGRPPAQGGVAKGRPVRPGSHLRVRAREDRHPCGRDAQRQPPVECGRVAAPRHPVRGDRADGGLCEPGSTAARQGPRPDAERRPARRGRGDRHRPAVSLPQRRTYLGPWAEISNVVTEGDDWEFDEDSFEICGGGTFCPPPS